MKPLPALPSLRIRTFPLIHRGSMVARPWTRFWRGALDLLTGNAKHPDLAAASLPWKHAAAQRRTILLTLVTAISATAAALLYANTPAHQPHPLLHFLQLALFVLLFGWISAGFITAMMGLWVQWRGDRHALRIDACASQPLSAEARTAIIMPICNEPVEPVFAGLRATCESLAASDGADLFDVFILSDSNDPLTSAQELRAWGMLRQQLGERCRLYYRQRLRRTRRKAGNVADFCRRWGKDYRYMVVLDADSVMTGETVTQLVRAMEAHPDTGIIQTAPRACGVDTLHARTQQFAGRVVGRLFTAGMQFWQLGESHYWGHNAIIRVAPFMQHCALATLPGTGGLSGDILSHDFLEAAMMRRAGYHAWLTTDLEGSYEQQPSNLMEELQRDRRWCQVNLMNFRVIAEPGFQPVHRAMLLTGALSYVSAPLWLAFVLLSLALQLMEPPASGSALSVWFGASPTLTMLWGLTLSLLFLPRLLAVIGILLKREQAGFGGTASLLKSALLELAISSLQAPIRMVAHTLFVFGALSGLNLKWKSPGRESRSVAWNDAWLRFLPVAALVLPGLLALLYTQRDTALWLLPTALPVLLAAPIAVFTSHAHWGVLLRRHRWLLTPEERFTPDILARTFA